VEWQNALLGLIPFTILLYGARAPARWYCASKPLVEADDTRGWLEGA
jgi:hypothetical protein